MKHTSTPASTNEPTSASAPLTRRAQRRGSGAGGEHHDVVMVPTPHGAAPPVPAGIGARPSGGGGTERVRSESEGEARHTGHRGPGPREHLAADRWAPRRGGRRCPRPCPPISVSSTPSWSEPGSPGCTCCTGCGTRSACRRGCSRRPTTSAAPGTGTATRARGATRRATSTASPTGSPRTCSRSGPGASASPPSRRSCATCSHVADRFDLRRDIRFGTRVTAADLRRRRPAAGRSTPTTASSVSGDGSSITAVGCLSTTQPARLPGPRQLPRASGTTPALWPHEGVDFTGKRVAVIGTGATGGAGHPGDRRAGRARLRASSARRTTTSPAATAR